MKWGIRKLAGSNYRDYRSLLSEEITRVMSINVVDETDSDYLEDLYGNIFEGNHVMGLGNCTNDVLMNRTSSSAG